MKWAKIVMLALGALIIVAAVESQIGSTRYALNGATYAIPHKYQFMRNFRLTWLENVKGLDREPDQSVWLIIPAGELAHDIPGYRRMFHGYSSDVEADMVVNIVGGKEAREFPQDRAQQLRMVADTLASGEGQEADETTGLERIYSMRGMKGTLGEGGSLFYLMPTNSAENLPSDWRPPSCQGDPDSMGKETYSCGYIIYRHGLTFHFTLRRENLGIANRVPDYILTRLEQWRD